MIGGCGCSDCSIDGKRCRPNCNLGGLGWKLHIDVAIGRYGYGRSESDCGLNGGVNCHASR